MVTELRERVLELRDYQEECVKRVLASYEQDSHGTELLVLPCACHRKGQGILMYDGTIKSVEDIAVGDLLMGPDSTPRHVQVLRRGQDEMFEIKPKQGASWVANKHHVLTLDQRNEHPDRPYPSSNKGGTLVDVSIAEWLTWSDNKKQLHSLRRTGVDFLSQNHSLPIHPYLLGALLGDGGLFNAKNIQLTSIDKEVVEEITRILGESGFHLQRIEDANRTQSYRISCRIGKGRPADSVRTIQRIMKELGLLPIRCEDRFIPSPYKLASRQDRLELLAGLIDTDGHCSKQCGFEYCSKSEKLADDVCFVARSLGLAAYKSSKIVGVGTYYRVYISGDCTIIPTRIPRKQAIRTRQQKNVLRTGFTCKPTGTIEDYYGFTLDGDGRYLLDDFTITHNSGKTVIFSHITHALNERYGLTAIVIAHRDDLLDQAEDKYRMIRPHAVIGKVGSGIHNYGGEVTVASIATISRPEHIKRLQTLYGSGERLFLITDEAHHCAADGYQRVYEALPNAFHLMVTATPDRLDNKPILPIGRKPLFEKSIIEMIRQKFLTDVKCIAVKTKVSLDDVHSRAGDFRPEELADAVDSPARNRLIVEKYKEHTPGKRAVAFCVTVAHAQHLAEAFNEAGINAEVVEGNTPLDVRKQIYHRFRTGQTLIMTNVMVLSEGWDEPLCEVGIGARPTQSRALFVQQLGRILRLAPGKQYATWLEITDNVFNHKLVPQSLRRVLNKHHMLDNETILESEERQRQESAEREVQVHKLPALRDRDLHVNLIESYHWDARDNGMYVLIVGKEQHRIALIPEENEQYSVYARLFPDYEPVKWFDPQPIDWAMNAAERQAKMLLADPEKFIKATSRNAEWRKRLEPNSEKQIKMLLWKKIDFMGPLTKVEASDLIEAFFARKEIADKEAFKRKMSRQEVAAQKKTSVLRG